ncbi:MAG: phasin family protein [Pseudomonadota bacterium]
MADTNKSKSATESMAPLLAAWQGAGLGPLNWLAPNVVERMSDMGSEWLSFVATRVQEDVALQHQLLHAKTPADAQAVQARFLQTAMDQYTAETGKMMELGAKLFEPVDVETNSAADDDDDENVNV